MSVLYFPRLGLYLTAELGFEVWTLLTLAVRTYEINYTRFALRYVVPGVRRL